MFFRSYILRKSKFILLGASLFMMFHSICLQQTEPELYRSNESQEISAGKIVLSLPVEINHYKTEKPHTVSLERIDKAESVHCSIIKNKFKKIIFHEDQYEGLVRLQFFLINQFATST